MIQADSPGLLGSKRDGMYKTVIITSLIGLAVIGFFYSKQESSATNVRVITPVETQLASQTTTNKSLNNDQSPSTHSASTKSGLIAYISPVTGELTTQPSTKQTLSTKQTKAEIAIAEAGTSNQQASTQRQNEELPPIKYTTYENGMVRAQLNGHFMVPQTASVDCNGELHTKHAERIEVAETCVNR